MAYKLPTMLISVGLPRRSSYTAKEVAKILGCSVSTIYRMVEEGRLNARKLRQHLRVDRWALEEYLDATTESF